MGIRFSIPTGAVPDEHFEEALNTLTEKTAENLHAQIFGYEMKVSRIQARYEEIGKKCEILPKFFQNQITLRGSVDHGASVTITWQRRDPESVWISLDSSSLLEDYLFYGTFAIAALIAMMVPFYVPTVGLSRVSILVFFFPIWIVLQILNFGIRVLQRARNRCLLKKVEKITRESLAADTENILR